MSVITLTYKAKKQVTPVLDQIDENSETSNSCISQMDITITPSGTRYIEVVSNNGYSYADIVDGNISTPTNVTLIIDAFQSFQPSQNTVSSSITINVRNGGAAGTIEDSITLYRDHTVNIC